MSQHHTCFLRPHVHAHFTGRITASNERVMREHLAKCTSCREYYQRRLLLARLDPAALDPKTRLAIGLGLRPRRPGLHAPLLGLAGTAMAAALLLLLLWPGQATELTGFTARGPKTPASSASLLIYRVPRDSPPLLADDEIFAHDSLAFAYENESGKKRLLVFGVDEPGNVHWYHPAWADPADDPVAIPIKTGPGPHELHDAVSHALEGESLRVYGLFVDEAVSVRQVEELLRARDPGNSDPLIPSSVQLSRSLHVRR